MLLGLLIQTRLRRITLNSFVYIPNFWFDATGSSFLSLYGAKKLRKNLIEFVSLKRSVVRQWYTTCFRVKYFRYGIHCNYEFIMYRVLSSSGALPPFRKTYVLNSTAKLPLYLYKCSRGQFGKKHAKLLTLLGGSNRWGAMK